MNGGTFTTGKEKERAGIYFNFKTTAQERVSLSERGTVALPVASSWGEAKTFVSISSVEDLNKKWASASMTRLYCCCVKRRKMRKRY